MKNLIRTISVWLALAVIAILPIAIAAVSPLIAWREPVYIAAGLAGVVAMSLLLLQPLLVGVLLPGLSDQLSRRLHLWVGGGLVAAVVIHVAGLWATSPPDVVDALLFASPTPFSAWGVMAMWAVFAAALVIIFRRRLRPRLWRLVHTILALITVVGSVVHAMLIEGTMETVSKTALCLLVLIVTILAIARVRS